MAKPGQEMALGTVACKMAESTAKITGLPMTVTYAFAGAPSGTFIASSIGPVAQLIDGAERFMSDPAHVALYHEMASLLHEPIMEDLGEIVFGESDPDRPAGVYTVITGLAKGERAGEAVLGFVDLAKRVLEAGAVTVAVQSQVSGPYGGLSLLTGIESMEDFESTRTKFFSQQSNLDAIAALSPNMVEGAGESIHLKRLFRATP